MYYNIISYALLIMKLLRQWQFMSSLKSEKIIQLLIQQTFIVCNYVNFL